MNKFLLAVVTAILTAGLAGTTAFAEGAGDKQIQKSHSHHAKHKAAAHKAASGHVHKGTKHAKAHRSGTADKNKSNG